MTSLFPLFAAFFGGVLAFASPCVLPLIPAYLTYITGVSFSELSRKDLVWSLRKKTILHSLAFILGFTVVFVFMGTSISAFGMFLRSHRYWLQLVGGALIILLGILVTWDLSLLQREFRFSFHRKPLGYIGSFLVGITFAAGWTPCVGPILASILVLSSRSESMAQGMLLLFCFSLGMGIPFLVSAWFFNTFLTFFKNSEKYLGRVRCFSGIFLIAVGFLVMTGWLYKLSRFLVF